MKAKKRIERELAQVLMQYHRSEAKRHELEGEVQAMRLRVEEYRSRLDAASRAIGKV